MDIEKLKELIELANLLEGGEKPAREKQMVGDYVIVRCKDAGVHAGTLVDYEGREVTLTGARRLWYWVAAQGHTLNAVAEYGIKEGSKIPAAVGTIVLPEACEIIATSSIAQDSIVGFDEYEND